MRFFNTLLALLGGDIFARKYGKYEIRAPRAVRKRVDLAVSGSLACASGLYGNQKCRCPIRLDVLCKTRQSQRSCQSAKSRRYHKPPSCGMHPVCCSVFRLIRAILAVRLWSSTSRRPRLARALPRRELHWQTRFPNRCSDPFAADFPMSKAKSPARRKERLTRVHLKKATI